MFPKTSRKKKLRIQGGIVLRYFAIIGSQNLAGWCAVPHAGMVSCEVCGDTCCNVKKNNNLYCFVIPAESHPVIFHFCSTCVSYYSY